MTLAICPLPNCSLRYCWMTGRLDEAARVVADAASNASESG